MTHDDIDQLQRIIARELEVQPGADIRDEIQRRQAFLIDQLHTTGQHCLVLGISGGVDSTSAGLLAIPRSFPALRQWLTTVGDHPSGALPRALNKRGQPGLTPRTGHSASVGHTTDPAWPAR